MKLEEGTTVSHYTIISEIGKGGMGEVYLAQDSKLNRQVAIKFLSEEFSKDADKLNRFVQEAQAASALNHPNILTIYEIGEIDGTNYIATEFIEGKTLNKYLKSKDIKLGSVLDIAIQVASALDEAHSAGIVHRDIKPDNVMVRENGLAKILDFGIAKLTEKQTPEVESEDKTAVQVDTTPGMIIGTANYMSPEQAMGKQVDTRTDIFSFGVLLYEMISGRLPFGGETPMEIIASVINKEPAPMDESEVPQEITRILGKALRKDPDDRYQTIKGLLADLKELKEDLAIQKKLDKTERPEREDQDTQVFKATTAAEAQQTTAAGTNDSITIRKSGLGKGIVALLAIILISAIGLGYWYFSGGKQIESIAVMPFVNESGDKEVEYLSDGMTETLISSLTEIPNLSVKARSTVFYYKGKNKTPKEIGEELGVEAVLLGRLVQRGEELKLSLELVDTSTLDAIWSQSYDRKMNNLITLQSEIARNVSDKLRLRLSTSEQEKLARSGTASSEAQQLYLKGIFHFNKRFGSGNGKQEMERSVSFFKQAIEKDPNYALAYTGLAASYSLMPYLYSYSAEEYLPKGKEAAKKALELDPDLAEAHAALGNILLYSYDWEGAERSYLKAIEVNPKYAKAHQWYADYLAAKGMFDEALKTSDKAIELDPFDLVSNNSKIRTLLNAEKYDEAMIQNKKFIEMFPESSFGQEFLYRVYLGKGMEREAMEQWWIRMEKRRVPVAEIQAQKDIYKKEGLNGLRRKNLERNLAFIKTALERDKNAVIRYVGVSGSYADLKDKEKTLEYLRKAYQQRDPYLVDLKNNRRYDFLKDEPEYQALLKNVGFPESE